jgi:hypothetical protein
MRKQFVEDLKCQWDGRQFNTKKTHSSVAFRLIRRSSSLLMRTEYLAESAILSISSSVQIPRCPALRLRSWAS